jgi:glycosyltransferase A (GT-A) superfamily protein (DUF2064 family)
MSNGRIAIAVMAKAPQPGRVKTRLCPPLAPQDAADMGAAFLRDITMNLAQAARVAPIDPWVAFAPAGTERRFDGMLEPGTRLLLADGAGEMPEGVEGFGRCLFQATQRLLDMGYAAACVLNADSPTLPTARLARLAESLTMPGRRGVLGPAEDGGYYVLGLPSAEHRMFADIAWSTDRVADQTRERAAEIGLPLLELPSWYDVDDRAALARLVEDLRYPGGAADSTPFAAPATRACVERLALPAMLAA